MTEEDTFLKLKRRPLVDVYNEFFHGTRFGTLAVYTLMITNGWTLEDYYGIYYDKLLCNNIGIPKKEHWIKIHMTKALAELKYTFGEDFEL